VSLSLQPSSTSIRRRCFFPYAAITGRPSQVERNHPNWAKIFDSVIPRESGQNSGLGRAARQTTVGLDYFQLCLCSAHSCTPLNTALPLQPAPQPPSPRQLNHADRWFRLSPVLVPVGIRLGLVTMPSGGNILMSERLVFPWVGVPTGHC